MSDYWNERGLQCVENCKDRGMPVTAIYVKEIVEQRAELLEALKGMKDAFCNPESGEIDKRLAVQDMNKVITKVEAAE